MKNRSFRLFCIFAAAILSTGVLLSCAGCATNPNDSKGFAPDPTHSIPQYDALLQNIDTFPISFFYGDTEYSGFAGFTVKESKSAEIENGIETVTVLTNKDIAAEFKLISRIYPNEKAYEYTVYITNNGTENTDVFGEIEFAIPFKGENPVLSGLEGDSGSSWYIEYELNLDYDYSVESSSGRPTHSTFPYYNLSYGNKGTFIAIGWPGTWHSNFQVNGDTVTLRAGQNNIDTYIAPGETFRTPLMAFVEYENANRDEQVNIWRHYFLQDVMRKTNGTLPETVAGIGGLPLGLTTDKVLMMLKMYQKNDIDMSALWMDAGWYTGASGEAVGWPSTGTQEMDTTRFPDRMANIGAYCKENNMKMLLWFEPEDIRLDKEAFLANQPGFKEDWLLSKTMVGSWLEGYLLNLGDTECREWLLGKVCRVIDDAGVTVYRQDFNSNPAEAWTANDGENRIGMTENQYVQGYLAYWDALIAKYPNMMIDSCASGGGRNDLETMKRAVPLHYSDLFDGGNEDYDSKSRITQSLFAWFPYFKNEVYDISLYKLRMNYAPWSLLKLPNVMSKDAAWELLRQAYSELDQVSDYFYADYYKLTPYSTEKDRWNGWEFFDSATGSGYAQISCNMDSTTLSRTIPLKGLDAASTYQVSDFDGIVSLTATGKELMKKGVSLTVPEAPYCVILTIKKVS